MAAFDQKPAEFTVYSAAPWLIEGSPEAVNPLFDHAPVVEMPAHRERYFGIEDWVCRVEEGVIATYAIHPDMQNQMTGLFGAGSLLGAFKALMHERSQTPALIMKALTPVRARRVSARAFVDFLATDDHAAAPAYLYLLRQHEQQMEGMLLNDLLPVDVRLARIVDTLFRAKGAELEAHLKPVPIPVTVLQLAEMVHADRAFVSRILSKWREAGCFSREGRRLFFSKGMFETF